MLVMKQAPTTVEERNALVVGNKGLAYEYARKYFLKCQVVPLDDLCQIALCAMIRAAEKWEPARGKFSTFCHFCIRSDISDAFGRYLAISVPENQVASCAEARERALACESIQSHERSTGQRWETEAPMCLVDPSEALERRENRARLMKFIRPLPRKWRRILKLHFGLDGEVLNLRQISKRLGISHERVRQLEAKAIEKLRRRMGVGA